MAVTSNEFKQFLIDGLKLEDIGVDDINDGDPLFGDHHEYRAVLSLH